MAASIPATTPNNFVCLRRGKPAGVFDARGAVQPHLSGQHADVPQSLANPRFEDQASARSSVGQAAVGAHRPAVGAGRGRLYEFKGLGPGVASFRSVAPGSPNNFFLGSVGITPGPTTRSAPMTAPTFADTKIGGGQVKIDYDLGGGTAC
jgi:hypothetical protein